MQFTATYGVGGVTKITVGDTIITDPETIDELNKIHIGIISYREEMDGLEELISKEIGKAEKLVENYKGD